MRITSRKRVTRQVPASEFFRGAFRTTLLPDELLVDIIVPVDRVDDRWGYVKLKTTESSWPVVVAAARLTRSEDQPPTVSVTLGAAAETPFGIDRFALARATGLEPAECDSIRHAVQNTPALWWSDELTDGTYRRRVAGVIAVRAIEDAMKKQWQGS